MGWLRHALQRGSTPRFWLTSFLLAFVLTAFADTQPGKHSAPIVDWIVFTLVIALVRGGYRRIRNRGTLGEAQDAQQAPMPIEDGWLAGTVPKGYGAPVQRKDPETGKWVTVYVPPEDESV